MPKIKVVQIITRLIKGGAQKVCLDIAQGLPKNRYEVFLVSGAETGLEGSLWEKAQQIHGINIKVIPELVREISPIKDLLALLRLYYFFYKTNPDIVHCHTSKAGFIGCLAGWMAGVPVIIYMPHGHIFASGAHIPGVSGNAFKLKIFYILRRASSFICTKIIAVNNADKNEQVALRLAPSYKYEVIYNAIDIKEDAAISDVLLPNRYPIIATAGRLSSEKGQVYLLEAIKLVKKYFPDTLLLIIGDGLLRTALETKVEQLNIKNNIKFLGMLDNIIPTLKKIDIFALPSLYESFGIVLLEAMAVGKPIVASKINGIPEVVLDGKTGILVPSKQSDKLAEAIIKLSQDKELSRHMGKAGYQRLKELFLVDQMVRKFDGLYKRLLGY